MDFALLVHGDEKTWAELPEADQQAVLDAHAALHRELTEAGVTVRYLAGLTPSTTGKVVKAGGMVTDGPYTESREQLGGLYLIDVPSEEDAIRWARKVPLGPGEAVEVRRCLT